MNEQDPLIQKVRQTLDRQKVDDAASQALTKARNSALDSQARQPLLAWKPVASFASMLLIVGGLLVYGVETDTGFPAADAEDLAVIASEDELEFFQELEFYIWFDEDQKV